MPDDYEYFKNKRTDRIYLSRSLENKILAKDDNGYIKELVRPFRIVSKVLNTEETHKFIKDGKEVSLRITDGGKQEIKAKFYEDTRELFNLQIQKYTIKSGAPHNTYFSFAGSEIAILYNFIRNIPVLPIDSRGSAKLDDQFVESLVLSKEQLSKLLHEQPDLVNEIVANDLTTEDVVNLAHRKKQLGIFESLINDDSYFEKQKNDLGKNKRDEDVWQDYFERNTWIFGYGLNYFFNTPLDDSKLEQVVKGYDFNTSGKRVDALLKTQGIVSTLSFGEIKTHKTELLHRVKESYRNECWRVSKELSGGVAQVQKTVQISLSNIRSKTEIKDSQGNITGEELYFYQPKSFLVVGSLAEFEGEHGINEDKYSSFELFRKNINNPEIITFDELYERAKFIVESSSESA